MNATPKSLAAAIAVNRFGLGARPGDLERVERDPQGWLGRQLEGRAPVVSAAGLQSSSEILGQSIDVVRELAQARREKKNGSAESGAVAAAMKLPALYRPIYFDETLARFSHAIGTERPFLERLTQFWTNHFAVSVDKITVLGLAGAMEREAIRPHVTGTFVDLLMAVEKHPAMLLYLDNPASIGPHSRAARLLAGRGRDGGRKLDINENLAREILELHTLGVEGGYTQADVTIFAKAITGWSIGGDFQGGRRFAKLANSGKPGEFHFREAFHEPGTRKLLGKSYDDNGLRQGEAMLADLALHPATARHVCTKLARHFIADDPPAAVIERMARAWLDGGGKLMKVYEALLESPEAWSEPLSKFKTPADYLHSSYRALAMPMGHPRQVVQAFETLGQRSLGPGSPAGWPDTSADWDGSSALLKRLAWADSVAQRIGAARNARQLAPQLLGATLGVETTQAIARAESGTQALTLLMACPEFMRR